MFALALITLALAVMVVGGESGLFFRRSHYYVVFPNADGLLDGAPVKMAGVTIGTVSGIRLPTDPEGTGIRVRLAIDPSYSERVRQDSRAALRILQLLTNEKFVEIIPGTTGPALAVGSEIPRYIETGVLERGQLIAEDLGEITAALKDILGKLERGEGLLGELLHDPDFGRKGLDALSMTFENARDLTADMRAGKGMVGRLLYDESLAARLDDLGQAVESFAGLMEAVGGEKGGLREMLAEGGEAPQAIASLQEAAAGLNRIVHQLESDNGLLGRLLNDPGYSARLADDLESTLSNVAEITGKINSGEGSLGAMVNERVLYDGAEEVIAGVNNSKFARWMMRHYQKKGIKELEKREKDERKQEATQAAAQSEDSD
jgi:phospholipid/cholesterol/gamma-HCH transport system substrate-binding protein